MSIVRSWLLVFTVCLGLAVLVAPAAAQTIYFDPSVSYPNDFVFTVDIAIDCQSLAVKGIETVIAFDPFLLQLDAVVPGPWFTGTGQGHFFFDYSGIEPQGTIHFASSILDGTNDQDTILATCHFTALGYGSTPLIFQDVDVRDGANVPLGFGHSTGDYIYIDPAIKQADVTFGTLKATYR
jgi:hypothetical protein